MRYEEFVQRVQERIELQTSEEAERATEATLATLGESLYRTERDHLAAQLAKGLKEFLYERKENENTRLDTLRFPLEEFYNRVSARSGVRYPHAVRQAQAVMSVLKEAVSAGELKDILAELPEEYDELFGAEPRGPGSPSLV